MTDKYRDLAERLRELVRKLDTSDFDKDFYRECLGGIVQREIPLILSALEDAARLEWLERNMASIGYCDPGGDPAHWLVSDDLENESPIAHGATLRGAIDAARRTGR